MTEPTTTDPAVSDSGATPDPPPAPPTKAELLDRARELNVQGRSRMDVDELVSAIAEAEASGELKPSTPEEVGRPELVEVAKARAARREKTMRVIGAPNDPQED